MAKTRQTSSSHWAFPGLKHLKMQMGFQNESYSREQVFNERTARENSTNIHECCKSNTHLVNLTIWDAAEFASCWHFWVLPNPQMPSKTKSCSHHGRKQGNCKVGPCHTDRLFKQPMAIEQKANRKALHGRGASVQGTCIARNPM